MKTRAHLSRFILVRMGHVSDKSCGGKKSKDILCLITFFFQRIVVFMRFYIKKETKYVVVFTLQQWLRERTTALHYTYIAHLVTL